MPSMMITNRIFRIIFMRTMAKNTVFALVRESAKFVAQNSTYVKVKMSYQYVLKKQIDDAAVTQFVEQTSEGSVVKESTITGRRVS